MTFLPQGNPVFTYRYQKSGLVETKAEELLNYTEAILADMQRLLKGQ